ISAGRVSVNEDVLAGARKGGLQRQRERQLLLPSGRSLKGFHGDQFFPGGESKIATDAAAGWNSIQSLREVLAHGAYRKLEESPFGDKQRAIAKGEVLVVARRAISGPSCRLGEARHKPSVVEGQIQAQRVRHSPHCKLGSEIAETIHIFEYQPHLA